MKKLFLAVWFLGSTACFSGTQSLEELIKQLKQTSSKELGTSESDPELDQQIDRQIQAIGKPAIPSLLALLQDGNSSVRTRATFILRDIEGLTPEDLPVLIKAVDEENEEIFCVIARINSHEAESYLIEALLNNPLPFDDPKARAVALLGKRVLPKLLALHRANQGWTEERTEAICDVWSHLRFEAGGAVEELKNMAIDSSLPVETRIRALRALRCIGPYSAPASPELVPLLNNPNESIRFYSEEAIVGSEAPEALPLLSKRLAGAKSGDRQFTLRTLFWMGPKAMELGPQVTEFLDQSDWDLRLEAIKTLGQIGYRPAITRLTAELENQEDWRAVYFAAEALGRLRAGTAKNELEKVAESQWYEPVRKVARRALSGDFQPGEFLTTSQAERGQMISDEEFKQLRFPLKPFEPPVKLRVLRAKEKPEEQNYAGLKVPNGWLIGTDRGEWGGATEFVDESLVAYEVVSRNTEAIQRLGDKIVAVTGLAHLGFNDGFLYVLHADSKGKWSAKPWRTLPGAPRFSVPLQDGRLLINCYGDGVCIVSPTGEMQSLTRDEALQKPSSADMGK